MYSQNTFNETMNQWVDTQKKIFSTWQETFTPNHVDENQNKINDTLNPMEFFNPLNKINKEFLENNLKSFGKNMPFEIFHKMTNSTDTYTQLYNFWQNFINNATMGDSDSITKFYSAWQKDYMNIFSETFVPFFPQSMQDSLKVSTDIFQTYFDTTKKFSFPWIENAATFQDLTLKGYFGDHDALLKYTKLFRDSYDKTFGKFFTAPIMGISREYFEKQINSMDSFTNYLNTQNEFYATIYSVGSETMEKIMTNYQDMIKNGNPPETFKEFYTYWWKENEEAYKTLFNTDDFSKLLSQLTEASISFKKNFDTLLEEQLQCLPIPTKTDMNSLYKTIYTLKREVRNLKTDIDTLTNELNSKEQHQ